MGADSLISYLRGIWVRNSWGKNGARNRQIVKIRIRFFFLLSRQYSLKMTLNRCWPNHIKNAITIIAFMPKLSLEFTFSSRRKLPIGESSYTLPKNLLKKSKLGFGGVEISKTISTFFMQKTSKVRCLLYFDDLRCWPSNKNSLSHTVSTVIFLSKNWILT